MFDNFKWFQRFRDLTSDEQSGQYLAKSENQSFQPDKHSMTQFYNQFIVIDNDNQHKKMPKKSIQTHIQGQISENIDLQQKSPFQAYPQVYYLKKKQSKMDLVETNYFGFKINIFSQKQKKLLRFQLENPKTSTSKIKRHLPVNYFIQDVNDFCSKYTYFYLVFKKWAGSITDSLNKIILEDFQNLNDIFDQSNIPTKTTLGSVKSEVKEFRFYNLNKQSTVNASQSSSASTFVTKRPQVSCQSMINSSDFDISQKNKLEVKSWCFDSHSFLKKNNDRSKAQFQCLANQQCLIRELLMMVRNITQSLQNLKQHDCLPKDLRICDILWDLKGKQVSKPIKNESQKIFTTLNHEVEEKKILQKYFIANSIIPKPILQEIHQTNLSTNQLIQKNIDLLKVIQNSSYPSPEEISGAHMEKDTLFDSLLFKLGIILLELWLFYQQILYSKNKFALKSNQNLNFRNGKSIKSLIYQYDQKSIKINWLQLFKLLNHVSDCFDFQNFYQDDKQSKVSNRFLKVLKNLQSRSALQRRSALTLVNSYDFIAELMERCSTKALEIKHSTTMDYMTAVSHYKNFKKYSNPGGSQIQNRSFFSPQINKKLQNSQHLNYLNYYSKQRNNLIAHPNQTLSSISHKKISQTIYQRKYSQIVSKIPATNFFPTNLPEQSQIKKSLGYSQAKNALFEYKLTMPPEINHSSTPRKNAHGLFLEYQTLSVTSLPQMPKTPSFYDFKLVNESSESQIKQTQQILVEKADFQKKQQKQSDFSQNKIQNQQINPQKNFGQVIEQSMLKKNQQQKQKQSEETLFAIEIDKKEQTINLSKIDNILIQDDQADYSSPNKHKFQQNEKKESILIQKNIEQIIPKEREFLSETIEQSISSGQANQQSTELPNKQNELEYVIEQYKGGGRYEGYIKNKKRNGYGKLYYHEGSYYDGQWFEDQMNGFGKLFYSNGMLAYEGHWKHDQFNGFGKVFNDNPTMLDDSFDYTNFNNLEEQWAYYQGELQNDLKQGQGKIMLQNGQFFQGIFHNDRINGKGRFITLEGQVIQGIWKQNVMIQIL